MHPGGLRAPQILIIVIIVIILQVTDFIEGERALVHFSHYVLTIFLASPEGVSSGDQGLHLFALESSHPAQYLS